MEKIETKSWLAKLLICCHTITLFGFIKTKKSELTQRIINHECIHINQWEETTLSSYLLVVLIVLLGASKWMLILPPLVFYIWYVIEWLVRLFINKGNAYRSISFEQEAYANEDDNCYNENRDYFAFLKYFKKETKQ